MGVHIMSVHKNARLEIRVAARLKERILNFCDDNEIDYTYYLTTLIRQHLKKVGYLKDKKKPYYYNCDVEDMPGIK